LAGKPYMGVGRNLSYKKGLFYRTKGFIAHYNIPSGDDDLFISQVATKTNTAVELNKAGFVYSTPKESWSSWFKQKKRHLQTATKYKLGVKFLLAFNSLTQALFYLLLPFMFFFQPLIWVAVGGYALRFLSQLIIHKKIMNRLDEGRLCLFSLFWEPFHLMILFFIALTSKLSVKKEW
jgi:hypothetical protein